MSDIAISVENLSKLYHIGLKEKKQDTLGGTIMSLIKAPLENYSRLKKHSVLSPEDEDEDILWALKDVSFKINKGDVVGIIGKNGAGKSTLLKILSRITDPSSGVVVLNGRFSSLLEVGTGFHPELTGRENIYLNGTILGMSKVEIDKKFDEIVAFSEVEKFLDTPVKRYSSGMRVRLAFSVAASLEPEILMIDEVLAVGDIEFQKKCLGKMENIAQEGRTVLFVSHNMAAVQALCSKGIWIDSGRVRMQGTAEDVIAKYINAISGSQGDNSNIIDLTEMDRSPSLTPIIVNGTLNDLPLHGQHTILPRKECVFEFTIQLPKTMKECTCGIHFEDGMGTRIYAHNSRWTLKKIQLEKGTHKVKCAIPEIPLIPGHYYLSFGFSSANKQIDWLERITHLEVSSTDVYGTGELPGPGQGYYLADGIWDITPGN